MTVTVSRSNWDCIQRLLEEHRTKNEESSFASELTELTQAADSAAAPSDTGEVLKKLSAHSAQVLKNMKAGRSVSADDWSSLMAELKDMGAVTKSDCLRTSGDAFNIRYVVPGLIQLGPGERRPEDDLVGIDDWPGDPLDKLDALALYARKWIGILNVSWDDEGNPGSQYTDAFVSQEESCLRVSKLVRELVAMV